MRPGYQATHASFILLLLAGSIGCRLGEKAARTSVASSLPTPAAAIQAVASPVQPEAVTPNEKISDALPVAPRVQPAAYSAETSEEITSPQPWTAAELEVESLVASVLAVNPDIQAATAAWRAAAQRYPQEISLQDPMFDYMLGPASWGSPHVDNAYAIQASQAVPWPGKRQLRGNIARANASAAFHDIGEERLRIAQAARMAYYDYYLAHRQLAVLKQSTELMRSFRTIANSKYESAEVEQQDVLLADVELAELDRRQLELAREAHVAKARINTLLLVSPTNPLPPPPTNLPLQELSDSSEQLRALALVQRPELTAQASRIDAQRNAVALACREFYPDMEFVGRYDAFWQHPEEDLRPMVGMNINVPLYKQKRYAAVREARAKVAQQQAELDSQFAEIGFAVEQAFERVEESRKTLAVYKERLLPTAGQSIESARASYVAGKLDFLRLVESQRQSLMLQDRYYEAIAQYHQRVAELSRVVGSSLPSETTISGN
jgi:cobalt-zinc-cadmium efflux system outer membrane protein